MSDEWYLKTVVSSETKTMGCRCRHNLVAVQDEVDDHWEVLVIHQHDCPMEIP